MTTSSQDHFVICALYRFVSLEDFEELKLPILEQMLALNICGTLLLAHEGINGTIAGSRQSMDTFLAFLKLDPRLLDLTHKESFSEKQPFKRTKVKLKKEIVTMGIDDLDPNQYVGTYVEPEHWNALIQDPDVLLVDTRNDYEVEVGTFKDAINPNTQSFREFPRYIADNLDANQHKKVAMFCTGGIRCEKSTSYMKTLGFDEVYHLKGGILKYLEEVDEKDSLWEGECFVFDDRVTVDHQLRPGHYDQCHACRRPITDEDKQSEYYQQGVSCPRCFHEKTDEDKARYAEREKQIQLSRSRGETHLGLEATMVNEQRKRDKQLKRKQQQEDSVMG